MEFKLAKIEEVTLPPDVKIVTALHACDTATDDALAAAVHAGAEHVAVVPCCQAELARLLKDVAPSSWSQLWRHGIHRREFGSHATNVVRALTLESMGYQISVTELVGWEHSMKNEFILGRKFQKANGMARKQLNELLQSLGATPKITRLLEKDLA